MKMKKAVTITCITLSLFSQLAYAWNFTGHVVIAQIAYDNLNPIAKNKADTLAAAIFTQLPSRQQEKLNQRYPSASTFAKLTLMPDVWRKWQLGTVFNTYHASVPLNLLLYAKHNTRAWHYMLQPYPATEHCMNLPQQNVAWVIPKLETDVQTVKATNSKALVMVFLEHYVGDINQPLHNISHVNSSCVDDKGGNDFCLVWNKKGRCSKNLHSLWDSAVGYLKPKDNIARVAYRLEQAHPRSEFATQLQDPNPKDWAQADYHYAAFIYSLTPNQKPTSAYYQQGQAIAKSQLAFAGYELANVLNTLLVN